MSEKKKPGSGDADHLKAVDLERSKRGTGMESPLVANEVDAFIPDTELDNPDRATKEMAKKNDPTESHPADH